MKTLASHSQSLPCLRKLGSGLTGWLSIHPSDIMIFLFYDFSFNPLFFLYSFKGGSARKGLLIGGGMFHQLSGIIGEMKIILMKSILWRYKKRKRLGTVQFICNCNFHLFHCFRTLENLREQKISLLVSKATLHEFRTNT